MLQPNMVDQVFGAFQLGCDGRSDRRPSENPIKSPSQENRCHQSNLKVGWIMLIREWVVEELGNVPNWRRSTIVRMAGLMYLSTTTSSATFDKIGDNEIGRKCLLTSRTDFRLGNGVTSAIFQDAGRQRSRLRISFTGLASASAFSLKIQIGRPSGPGAFEDFKCSCKNTEFSVDTSSKVTASTGEQDASRESSGKKEAIGVKKASLIRLAKMVSRSSEESVFSSLFNNRRKSF